MPSRNHLKNYVSDSFYHIYNRGVGKMPIFRKKGDFVVFLYYLKTILSPPELIETEIAKLQQGNSSPDEAQLRSKMERLRTAVGQSRKLRLYQNVELLSFCLMPNHFHLLVYQKVKSGIEWLMRRLASGYSSYFTREYSHLGPLYQRRYQASRLSYNPEVQAIVASRYIERNPSDLQNQGNSSPDWLTLGEIEKYPFSSLKYYVTENKDVGTSPFWLNTKRLTNIFDTMQIHPNGIFEAQIAKHASYPDFVLSRDEITLEDIRLAHLESLD